MTLWLEQFQPPSDLPGNHCWESCGETLEEGTHSK